MLFNSNGVIWLIISNWEVPNLGIASSVISQLYK